MNRSRIISRRGRRKEGSQRGHKRANAKGGASSNATRTCHLESNSLVDVANTSTNFDTITLSSVFAVAPPPAFKRNIFLKVERKLSSLVLLVPFITGLQA